MSRSPSAPRHKKRLSPNRQPAALKAPRPGVQTVDPATEKEINAVFVTYLKRMGLTLVVMAVAAAIVVTIARASRNIAAPVVFLAAVTGLMLSYRRGVEKVFAEVKRIGVERTRSRRYADAIFALEHFHRTGNMGFDRDGEAHYHLTLAYLGLGDSMHAQQTADWLARYRAKSPYAERAASAVQEHARNRPPAETTDNDTR